MPAEPPQEITQLLQAWRDGDAEAYNLLVDQVYLTLKELSRNALRGDRQRFVWQPTELVHECSARLMELERIDWQNRAHFFAMAATVMRRVLVDQGRRQQAEKRAGEELTLRTEHFAESFDELDFDALDQALDRLAMISAEKARIVELKFFAGMTNTEIGEALDMSDRTVKRHWRAARAWLLAELTRE